MRKWLAAFTLVEMLVVIAIIAILAALILPALSNAREEARKATCKSNCKQIGGAIDVYRQNYGSFYPFTWYPADWYVEDSAPSPGQENASGATTERSKDALTSLGCLYPGFLQVTKIWKCPSMENAPHLTVHWPSDLTEMATDDDPNDGVINVSEALAALNIAVPNPDVVGDWYPGKYLWSQRNWALHDTGYGYDCRISPSAVSQLAIFGDMDGSYAANRNTSTQNHTGGGHVLFVDSHVSFETGNFCSSADNDNVYVESGTILGSAGHPLHYGWHADSDAFLSDNTSYRDPVNDAVGSFDGGGWNFTSSDYGSYTAYPSLHPAHAP